MADTPRIGIEELEQAVKSKYLTINSAFQLLDALVQASVEDKDLTAPPAHVHGNTYIVGGSATGDWSGEDGNIAQSYNSAWYFYEPEEGYAVYVKDENKEYKYDGSNWVDNTPITMSSVTGFPNRTDSTLAWVDGTRTLTITGSYDVWYQGVKESFPSGDSLIMSDDEGYHLLCYISNVLTDVLITSHSVLSNALRNYALVAGIHWNTTDNEGVIVGDERHGIVMDSDTHHYLHETRGAQWFSGFDISAYTLVTDSDAAISFDLTDGVLYDEDIQIEIEDGVASNQYEQVLTGDAEIPVIYRDDVTGEWTQSAASTLPYLTSGTGRVAYNNDDGDGTWSQVEATNNDFVLYTLIATNDWVYPIKMIQGNSEYSTSNAAKLGARQELIDFGPAVSNELTFLYRFIIKTSDGFSGTKKSRIENLYDLRGINSINFRYLIQNSVEIT